MEEPHGGGPAGLTAVASPALQAPHDVYTLRRREALYRWVADACVREGRERVIDVDCGDGYGTAVLAAAGLEAVGVSADPGAVRAAARTYRFGRISFRAAELPDTAEAQHSFDAVVSAGLLEMHDDPRPVLRELRRLVRPGGAVIVVTPNRLTASPGRTRPVVADRAWEYTPDEFRDLFGHAFPGARFAGVFHARRLRMLERVMGGSLALNLYRVTPADRTAWLRFALQGLRASSFEVGPGTLRTAVDLVGTARA